MNANDRGQRGGGTAVLSDLPSWEERSLQASFKAQFEQLEELRSLALSGQGQAFKSLKPLTGILATVDATVRKPEAQPIVARWARLFSPVLDNLKAFKESADNGTRFRVEEWNIALESVDISASALIKRLARSQNG